MQKQNIFLPAWLNILHLAHIQQRSGDTSVMWLLSRLQRIVGFFQDILAILFTHNGPRNAYQYIYKKVQTKHLHYWALVERSGNEDGLKNSFL